MLYLSMNNAAQKMNLSSPAASAKEGLLYKPFIHILLIIVCGFLAYSNTFNTPFVFDDKGNIIKNPAIKDFRYFTDTSEINSTAIPDSRKLTFKTRYIGYLTFAINYSLHGLDVMGYHLFNILVHIINSLLLYWLVTLTFKTPFFAVHVGKDTSFPDNSRNFIAIFSALLFAAHPIQTQAVTYIVQRFTSLATMFYLLSLVMYIKFRIWDTGFRMQDTSFFTHRASWILYLCSLISVILAMKTKEISFTLPFIIILYEFYFFNNSPDPELKTPNLKRFLYILPFLLTLLIIPLTLIEAAGSLAEISGTDKATVIALASDSQDMSRWDYLFTQFRVIVTYIRLLFLPASQNLDYDYPTYDSFFNPNVILSFLFLLSILMFGIYLYRLSHSPDKKNRYWIRLISFGIFWFFITLSAESFIIPIKDVIFEHRVYLPSAGAIMAFSAAIFYALQFTVQSSRVRVFASRLFLPAACLLLTTIIIVFSIAAYQRNAIWKDEISLWEDTARKSPDKARPHNNLGLAYSIIQNRNDKAINEYQTALRLTPNYADAHFNLGVAYMAQGKNDDAANEFQIVLNLNSDYPMARQFFDYLLRKSDTTQLKTPRSKLRRISMQ